MQEAGCAFLPAKELHDFIRRAFIEEGAPFYRDEYEHLRWARIAVQWTNTPKVKAMVAWAACARLITTGGDKWSKAKELQLLREWYGGWWEDVDEETGLPALPDFELTFYGPCATVEECSDITFAARCAHELLHCAQDEKDGEKQWGDDGRPKFAMRDHGVSTWVEVGEDFGPVERGVPELMAALAKAPRFPGATVSGLCGTCLRPMA